MTERSPHPSPDVLIVGAGPAGALAAVILARAGVRVRLYDRAAFPRTKLCGDTLNPGAMRLLAAHGLSAPIVARGRPLDGMLLTGPRVAVRGRYESGERGYAIARYEFDHELVRQAQAAGAAFEDGVQVTAAAIDPAGHRVRGVEIERGGQRSTVRAPLVIAADGRASRLSRGVGLAAPRPSVRRWAIGGYFRDVHDATDVGEMHVRRGHYIGVAPLPDGLTNACLVATPGRGDPAWRDPTARLWHALRTDARLAPRFERARLVGEVSVLGPMAVEVRGVGVPGLLLAGDAAGFIDPMTGDGLRLALSGGALAARVALDVLSGGIPLETAPQALARSRRAALATKLRFNRTLRSLVSSPSAVTASAALARVAPSIFTRVIRYAGDTTGVES